MPSWRHSMLAAASHTCAHICLCPLHSLPPCGRASPVILDCRVSLGAESRMTGNARPQGGSERREQRQLCARLTCLHDCHDHLSS